MKLSDPFEISQLHVRVGSTNKDKTKGLALVYLDARDVMDRLDECHPNDWNDEYEYIGIGEDKQSHKPYHCFKCTLYVKGISHSDVGQGDEHKDAVSDALKRAAVKFGVGRYLYDTPNQWFKLNQYKQFEESDEKIIDYLMKKMKAGK